MLLLAATMALAVGVAACGSSDDDSGDPAPARPVAPGRNPKVLDFVPSAVHSSIYEAVQKGYYEGQRHQPQDHRADLDRRHAEADRRRQGRVRHRRRHRPGDPDQRRPEAQGIMAIAQRPRAA